MEMWRCDIACMSVPQIVRVDGGWRLEALGMEMEVERLAAISD
jgi:hypothetical protein